jgi:hypothetical protein
LALALSDAETYSAGLRVAGGRRVRSARVLRYDRGEVELVSCTGKTSEPHSFEAVVDLQVSKAHFDTLTFVT